jgi:excisionase family DNA binding protein
MSDDARLVCVKEACAIADINRSTLYRWIRIGRVQTVRTAGGRVRIVETTLFRPARRESLRRLAQPF